MYQLFSAVLIFWQNNYYVISNLFQFLLKLSYPIEKRFLLQAGFELRTLLLVSDADTLTITEP